MKKVLVVLLCLVLTVSFCIVPTAALDDANNGNIKFSAMSGKNKAFMEDLGPDNKFGFDVQGYVDLGNGDGILNSLDAALILKYDAFLITDLTPIQLMLCDANGDGIVNSIDAAQILKYDAYLITEFPNADFSLEAYIQLCLDYYGYYGTSDEVSE